MLLNKQFKNLVIEMCFFFLSKLSPSNKKQREGPAAFKKIT